VRAEHGNFAVTMDLPDVSSAPVEVTDDGTAVYLGEHTDVAVQALSSGSVRTQSVLNDRSAASEYVYDFDGLTPVLKADGSVDLVLPGEGSTVVVGTVAVPWAIDAAGATVSTRYRVEGSRVVQQVDHTAEDYVYPVVADPWITLGWRFYVNYTKDEVRRIAPYAWTARFSTLVCLTIPNIVIAGACAIAVDQQASGLAAAFQYAARTGRCMQLQFLYPPATLLVGYRSFAC
jgi:hypothetical protein